MTDFLSDDARPDPRDTPAEAEASSSRLDRRSFLRALSGSALTMVAGGLTVTLTACQGASSGSSPTTVNVPFSGVGPQAPPSLQSASSLGSITLPSGSSSSVSSSSGSSTSGASGSSTSSSSSRTSSSSSSSVTGALRRAAGKVNGWSTRV